MKALVGAFNQENALVGAFSVITNLRMELFEALVNSVHSVAADRAAGGWWSPGSVTLETQTRLIISAATQTRILSMNLNTSFGLGLLIIMVTSLFRLSMKCYDILLQVGAVVTKKCAQDPEFSCPDSATCCPLPKGEGAYPVPL